MAHETDATSDFPFRDSAAAKMLAVGIEGAQARHVSLRSLGKQLNYRQAVVLSHMASGRVPIPIDRAAELAEAIGISAKDFLVAVLEQRHPNIGWAALISGDTSPAARGVLGQLEAAAGKSFGALSTEHMGVMQEVARDPNPRRRWLTVQEMSVMDLIRDLLPYLKVDALAGSDRDVIIKALSRR
jgi:hypothetical protein